MIIWFQPLKLRNMVVKGSYLFPDVLRFCQMWSTVPGFLGRLLEKVIRNPVKPGVQEDEKKELVLTSYSTIGFTLAMLILAISPGPGVFATVARALASGFRSSLAVICGIVLGDIIFLMLAVFGLSIIAQVLGNLFVVVRVCGGLYLVYLGIRIWRQKPVAEDIRIEKNSRSWWANFTSGLVITLSNPKVILFYGGFLPTFLDLSVLTWEDLVVVVTIVVIVLSGVMGVYGYLAGRARRMFVSPKTVRCFNRAAGGVMVATGVVIATRT